MLVILIRKLLKRRKDKAASDLLVASIEVASNQNFYYPKGDVPDENNPRVVPANKMRKLVEAIVKQKSP